MRFERLLAVALLAACGPQPEIVSLEPAEGETAGGTAITVRGHHLDRITAVELNGEAAAELVVVDESTVTFVSPGGLGSATLVARYFLGEVTVAEAFTYVPPPRVDSAEPATGPTTPGTRFTLRGADFHPDSAAFIGPVALQEVVVASDGHSLTGVANGSIPAGPNAAVVSGPFGEAMRAGAYVASAWTAVPLSGIDDAGLVHDLVRHPTSGRSYVLVTRGLFRSDDDGATWDLLLEGTGLRDLQLLPDEPAVVLAAGFAGVMRSEDGGATWTDSTSTGSGGFSGPVGLALGKEALLGWAHTSVFESTDGGGSFTEVATLPGRIWRMVVHPATQTVLAATDDGVLWSDDGGRSFTASTGVSGYTEVLCVVEEDPTIWTSNEHGTFRSEDGGRSFTEELLIDWSVPSYAVAYWPGEPDRWVIGGFRTTYVRDVGSPGTWSELNSEGALRLVLDGEGDLLAGTWSAGIVRLHADGRPPELLNRGLESPHIYSATVGRPDGRLYIGTGSGAIWSKALTETTWSFEGRAPLAPFYLGMAAGTPGQRTLYSSNNRIFHLDLGGTEGWRELETPAGGNVQVSFDGETTFAVSEWIWRRDGLGPWQRLTQVGAEGATAQFVQLVGEDLYVLATEPGGPELSVWVLPASGPTAWTRISPPVSVTTSSGWTLLAVSDGALFAGRGPEVYRLPIGGDEWQLADPGQYIASIEVDPLDRATVYAGGSGIRKSSDSGATWRDVPLVDGLWPGTQALALDPAHPRRVYSVSARGEIFVTETGAE